jgi:hypothetical protein
MEHKLHIFKTLDNNRISKIENECGRNPTGNKNFNMAYFTISKKEFVEIYKTEGHDRLCSNCLAKLKAIINSRVSK